MARVKEEFALFNTSHDVEEGVRLAQEECSSGNNAFVHTKIATHSIQAITLLSSLLLPKQICEGVKQSTT